MRDRFAYPLVGKTGLCNMFYPWARAVVWARDNNARVVAPNWVQLSRIGVWLRGEHDKRTYLNQFTNEGYITGFEKWWKIRALPKSSEKNPNDSGVVIFSGREEFGWMEPVKHEAVFLTSELERIVNPHIIDRLKGLPDKFIAVHIRKGDFNYTGNELQPDEYYLAAIDKALAEIGYTMPVLVFSDGTYEELKFLKTLKCDLRIMDKAPAIQDVLSISRATALVGTNHSTFSYWGGFLGRKKVTYWSKLKHRSTLPEDVCDIRYV